MNRITSGVQRSCSDTVEFFGCGKNSQRFANDSILSRIQAFPHINQIVNLGRRQDRSDGLRKFRCFGRPWEMNEIVVLSTNEWCFSVLFPRSVVLLFFHLYDRKSTLNCLDFKMNIVGLGFYILGLLQECSSDTHRHSFHRAIPFRHLLLIL
jgi:hypothetical protein